jgi:leucyl-tRNA synthetase
MAEQIDMQELEARWRERWQAAELDRADLDHAARPFYNLMEFPYPSGEGLHVGHVYTYSGADAFGRQKRMQGYDVFQPMGFDAFGIHSENYALKVGRHPAELIPANIRRFREEQLKRLGCAFDWSRELSTTDPGYYRWTQWLFLQLFKAGLAYQAEAPVNWCPQDQTVLANEQVIDGRCERCDSPVERKVMRQWFFRITAYADRLLDFGGGDFPEAWVRRQQAWIGRSEGAEIDFAVGEERLTVFTTRPDTLFGVTFLALAPEHPLAERLAAPERRAAVAAYAAAARNRSERERAIGAEKSGVFSGAYAASPAGGPPIPIWVADYVLASAGSGAVMGVPAHDARDFAFAQRYGLPAWPVVAPRAGAAELPYEGEGLLVESGQFSGVESAAAGAAITAWLAGRGAGRAAVRYRLRDWLISRQRYWGPPIPIVHCGRCGAVAVPDEQLPVELPYVEDFRPAGAAPLAAVEAFVATTCPQCGGPARRETDVSDTFLDSAWYFLRYPSAEFADRPWDAARTARWLPVDMYAGGPEHATMHHLYARFITMALHDMGLLPFAEPFRRLRMHGTIAREGAKMSKSRGNVVSPDGYIARYGADVTRMYMLFMGPWEEGGDFSDAGISGVARFVGRAWAALGAPPASFAADAARVAEADRQRARTIARVTDGIAGLRFHTAIAALMEAVGWLREHAAELSEPAWRRYAEACVLLLAPLAPHLAEELWARRGGAFSVHRQPWPAAEELADEQAELELPVQVGGRVRDRVRVPAGADEATLRAAALASPKIQAALGGAAPRRVVVVPGKLINIVT